MGDRVPQAPHAQRPGAAERRQPAGRGAGGGPARGRHGRGRAPRLAQRPAGAERRHQGPARRLVAAAVAAGRRAGRSRRPDPHRAAPPGRGGRLAGPHLGRGPAHRRRAPGQGDLQHRRLAERRAGHRGGFARCPARVHPVRRPAGRLADRAEAGLRPARPRPAARRGPRARRLPRPRDAPLAADVGRHRAAGLAARPGRGRLAAAGRARPRPGGPDRRHPDGRAPGGVRRALRRGRRGVARRGPAPRAPRLGGRGGQAPGPAQGRAEAPPEAEGRLEAGDSGTLARLFRGRGR